MIPIECFTVDFDKFESSRTGKAGAKPGSRVKWDKYCYWAGGIDGNSGIVDPEANAHLFAGWQALRATWARPDDPPSVQDTLNTLASCAQARDHWAEAVPDTELHLDHLIHREVQFIVSYFEWCLARERAEHANSLIRVEPVENRQCSIEPEIVSNLVATRTGADEVSHEISNVH